MATVSAILPNRNHAEELHISLAGLVNQSRPFDEIIVVDDASTDHSLDVIGKFRLKFPQIRLLQNGTRLGVPDTVNKGLFAASSDYVILASADEKIEPSMCSALMGCIEKYPQAQLVTSQFSEWEPTTSTTQTYGDDSPLGMWFVKDANPRFFSPANLSELSKKRFVWLSINTAMFKRAALLEAGGLHPELRWHSDWFAIYAVALRHGFCALREPLASFYYSPESYSARGMRNNRAQLDVMTNIQAMLHRKENADLLAMAKKTPAMFSPFMRHMIPALAVRPRYYDMLGPILRWWVAEILHGKRALIPNRFLTSGKSPDR